MAYEFEAPEFLTNQSADEIHRRMLAVLPSDIDCSANSVTWDLTRPSALEKAEFVEFELNETIKLMFPQWAYGKWLDYHGEIRNVARKEANCSFGEVSVTGIFGTVIPKGFLFATPANLSSGVLFETLEEVVLTGEADSKKMVTCMVEVQAVLGGISGNVASDTIKLMSTPLNGISYVSNLEPTSGGVSGETDDDYRERILEAIALGNSFTGCNSDYVRWAKSVSGVGYVVVNPEWNDPDMPDQFRYIDSSGATRCAGAVRLIIADENGTPANEQIVEDVYTYIMGEDEHDLSRLAPIGAKVTVIAPEGMEVDVSATLILSEGEQLETVVSRILLAFASYWVEVASDAQASEEGIGVIRWVKVGACIAHAEGVEDYTSLLVNGGRDNISVTQAQYPVTGAVVLVE